MIRLSCEGLSLKYNHSAREAWAVRDISYQFAANVFYTIIGKSGAGKSSLLHLLSGHIKPTGGSVHLGEVDLHSLSPRKMAEVRRDQIGFIFQDFQLLPELTLEENIALPQLLRGDMPDEDWRKELIDGLGLSDLRKQYPHQLSGGEQQRCAIARALVNHPEVIFADEPTGNLDKKSSQEVMALLLRMQRLYQPTLILVTHDLDIARTADVLLHMEDGQLVSVPEGRHEA